MSPSSFLSITSALLVLHGCSGDDCGPHNAPSDGLQITADTVSLTYGGLFAGANNDCPDPSAPRGVVSLTVQGTQVGGTGIFTICIPRPDKLMSELALGTDIQLIDVTGSDASCSYAQDAGTMPSGNAFGMHVCNNGTSKAGFAMTFDGALGLQRTCGANVDVVPVQLTGTVAVAGSH
jgi:hypothetical protein